MSSTILRTHVENDIANRENGMVIVCRPELLVFLLERLIPVKDVAEFFNSRAQLRGLARLQNIKRVLELVTKSKEIERSPRVLFLYPPNMRVIRASSAPTPQEPVQNTSHQEVNSPPEAHRTEREEIMANNSKILTA